MNPFQRFLRPPFYIGAGTVGAGAATLVVFNLLKWSLLLALLIVLVLVMVAVILILVRQLKKAKQAEEIEQSVVVQADKDIERSVPGKQAEMQDLKAEFLAAVERLKTSKRGGKAVLSTLPWYMVVGPSEAGKSVMLSRSGLQFALTDSGKRGRSVKGVGGTKSFEWWLTQEAVLLDMTGRMVGASGQFEDTGDWSDFLTVLRKQRPEKPLNGVIVVMPVDQLADRPEAQIEKQAAAIRERVQEVIHHLGVVFPVYVVFTKCDLIAGFAEFFSGLGGPEREQPWGATISTDRALTESAETLFDQEIAVLQAALADRRMARLPDVPDPLQRARAFAFPAQIERVRPALRRFLRVLFAEDASEKDQPLFRGFYFASGEAQGAPVDRVLEPAARAMGASLGVPVPPELPPGAWFVHELLTGVVFEDAGLVTTSRGQAERQKLARMFALGLLGIVLLTFVILFSTLSCSNGKLVGDTRRAAERVSTSVRPDATLLDNLENLEALRKNVAVIDSLKRHGAPWYRALGAYSGNPVREPALDLYTRKTLEALVGPSYDAMQAELDTLTTRFSGEFAELYYTFRSWRLLATPGQITAEDAPMISRVIQRLQAPRVRSMSADVRDRVNLLIDQQVEFLCRHPEYLEKRFFPSPNTYLLARGKSLLAQRWESASFYRLLIDQVRRLTRPLGVAALTDNSRLISGTAEVSGPYTRDGWEKQVRPRIGWWRSQMARDGDLRDAFGGRTPDLAGDLLNAYAADYAAQWVALLNGARGADAGGPPVTVAENLRLMAADETPLLALLAGASEQLVFAEDPASPLGRVQSSFAMMHEFAKAPPGGNWGRKVSSAARGLFKKNDPLDRSGLPSVRYLEQIRAAQREIAEKAKPGTDPQQYLALFAHGGSNAVQAAIGWLDQQAANYAAGPTREATVALLRLPIQMCVPGAGSLGSAGGGIAPPNWNELVFMPFQKTLAGKYPFAASGPDASVADFTEFFRPGGTFWSYYDANMKSLVKEDGSPAGETRVRQDIADYVRYAKRIRDAFFTANPAEPSLAFQIRTSTATVDGPQVFALHMHLDVSGQFTRYSNGVPQWEALQWPGPDPTVGAVLRAQMAHGVIAESKAFPGPWGLFKLLDQAEWGGTPGAPRVTWRLAADKSFLVLDYDIQPRGSAHPFQRDFFRVPLPTP